MECLNKTWLYNAISVIFQSPMLYSFSLKENITLGKNYDDMDIINALNKVGVYGKIIDDIVDLDNHVGNEIEDGGVEISGGEAQRLFLARLFLGNRTTLVLDEPTNHLDKSGYECIAERIATSKEKMIIVATHNKDLLAGFDRVYVLENGKFNVVKSL